ncbi:hypothetical protein [Trinickia fusca]|nr:hypothetical protein [Trinickia fusca]
MKTQYIAPMSLWLVVRKRFLGTGLFIEPAWVGSGEKCGPVVFVSRVLAESYAYLRNKYHGPDDSDTWKVVALQDFDLLDHARGVDGPLYCMMAFGFSMEDADSVICINAPRLRYVPLPFDVPDGAHGITFAFGQWVFDFMRGEWARLGLPEFDRELEATDELDALSITEPVQTAIGRLNVCQEPSHKPGLWAVFSTRQQMWVSACEAHAAVSRPLH